MVQSGGDWFVKFMAPWCGHCKRLKPDLEKLATLEAGKGDRGVKVGRVDCTVQKQVCKRFKVRGYPSLRLIRDSASAVYAYKGRSRSLEALQEFIGSGYAESSRLPFPSAGSESGSGDTPRKEPEAAAVGGEQKPHKRVVASSSEDSGSGKSALWDAAGAPGPEGRWDGSPGPSHLVRDLSSAAFERRTVDDTWLIQLCTAGVRACEFYRPTLERVASTLQGPDAPASVHVAAIDCQLSKSLCSQLSDNAEFPILFIQADGQRWTYGGKRKHDDLVEFAAGGFMKQRRDNVNADAERKPFADRTEQKPVKKAPKRSVGSIKTSALWDAPGAPGPDGRWDGAHGPTDLVRDITSESFDQALLQDQTRWLVQFCYPEQPTCLHYRATMDRLGKTVLTDGVKTAVFDCQLELPLCQRMGAYESTVPLVLLIEGGKVYKWTGARIHDQIAEWVSGGYRSSSFTSLPPTGSVAAEPASSSPPQSRKTASPPASNEGDGSSSVTILTTDNIGSHISDGRGWLLEFYAPFCGHCKRLAPTWEIVAKKLSKEDGKRIGVGKVDCTAEKLLEKTFKIRGYPQIRFLTPEGKFFAYKGPRTEESLLAFARGDHLKSDRVFLDELVMESYAPPKKSEMKKKPAEAAKPIEKKTKEPPKAVENKAAKKEETVDENREINSFTRGDTSAAVFALDPLFVVVLVTCMLLLVFAALALGYTLGHTHGMAAAAVAVSLGNTPQKSPFFGTPINSPLSHQKTPQSKSKKNK